MQIVETLLSIEFWKYLPISILRIYCQLNKQTHAISISDNFWPFLLKRDFCLEYATIGAKEKYLYMMRFMKFWSPKFHIMTEDAVELIEHFFPENSWNYWYQILELYLPIKILTAHEIKELIQNVLGECSGIDERIQLISLLVEKTDANHNLLEKIYKQIEEKISNTFGCTLENIKLDLINTEYKNLEKYVQTPLVLFIHGKPRIVKGNLEIVITLDNIIDANVKIVRDYEYNLETLYLTYLE